MDINEMKEIAKMQHATFLIRAVNDGALIYTGETLELKNVKPKTIFALNNLYYEMLVSSQYYCKYEDEVHKEYYTTKTSQPVKILKWAHEV